MALKNRYSTLRLKHDNQRQSKQTGDGNAGFDFPATAAATNPKANCRPGIQGAGPKSPWNQRNDLVRFEDDDEDEDDDDDEDDDEEFTGAEDVYYNEYHQQNTTVPVTGVGPPHTRDSLRESHTSSIPNGTAEHVLDNWHTASSDPIPGTMYFRTASETPNSMDLGGPGDMSCQLPSFGLSHTMPCTLDSPTAFLTGDQQQDAGSDSMVHSDHGEQPPAST